MKNAKHSWKSLLAAFLSVAILTMMFVPPLTAQATDVSTPQEPEKTETVKGSFRYEGETYYEKKPENVNDAADLQPGETLVIPVGENFVEGEYTLTVCSCGNRGSFEVFVNDVSNGSITRTGTGFGMDQMTDDKLSQTLTLKPGDKIGLKSPSGDSYGWVDYIQLDGPILTQPKTEPVEGGVRYHAEHFYDGGIKEKVAADLQPGETLNITLDQAFAQGAYTLTVRSCGNRGSFEVFVNDVSNGTITRTGTGFGMDQMTDDKLSQTLTLKPGDKIGLKSPSGDSYGWVDYIQLDAYTPVDLSKQVVLQEATATLEGNIGLNYYITLPDSIKADKDAYVLFTVNGTAQDPIKVEGKVAETDGTYKFTCLMNAKEMHDTVTFAVYSKGSPVEIYDKDGNKAPNSTSFDYSLAKYFDTLSNDNSQPQALVNLAKATAAYGSYVQKAFGYDVDTATSDMTLDDVTRDKLEAHKKENNGGTVPDGLTLYMNLILETETTFCVYYKAENGVSYSFTIDGNPATPEKANEDGWYCIKISNIAAKDLDTRYALSIKDGDNVVYTCTFNALSYAYTVVEANKDPDLCNAVKALYKYNEAADKYFASLTPAEVQP